MARAALRNGKAKASAQDDLRIRPARQHRDRQCGSLCPIRSGRSAHGRTISYFGDAPAMLRVISMASDTLSSNCPGLMLKSLRLMVKLARMTRRSPF